MNVLFPGEHTHTAFWVIVGADDRRDRGDGRLLQVQELALRQHGVSDAGEKATTSALLVGVLPGRVVDGKRRMRLRLDVVRNESEPALEQSLRFLCVMLGTFICAGLCRNDSHSSHPLPFASGNPGAAPPVPRG